jgi:spore cortex biosynthesis protein YabQ
MLCSGALCGVAYDVFRIVRRLMGDGFILTLLCDIFYWIVAFFILFRFVYIASNGEIQVVSFLFIIIGGALYFFGPSKITMIMLGYMQKGKKEVKKSKVYKYLSK